MEGGVLPRQVIRALLESDPPLLSGLPDPETQLQPCGVDLTVAAVARMKGMGQLGASDDARTLPAYEDLSFNDGGWLHLDPGCYLVTLNETIHLPAHLVALGWPRSSLLRCGVTVGTAVWDPGYHGRSQCLLMVHNAAGFRLGHRSRILQLVFFPLAAPSEAPYQGRYQGENQG